MEMIYGWCLPRTLHYKVTLRARHPEMRILMRKYDYSDAYRRIAHSAEAATQTIAANGNTAYLSLRLMFGGLPNPPTWCNSGQWQYGLPVPQTDVRGTAQPTNLVHVLRVGDVFGQQDWAVCQMGTRDPSEPSATGDPGTSQAPGEHLNRPSPPNGRVPADIRGRRESGWIHRRLNKCLRRHPRELPKATASGPAGHAHDESPPENYQRQPQVVPLAMHMMSRPHPCRRHAGAQQHPLATNPVDAETNCRVETGGSSDCTGMAGDTLEPIPPWRPILSMPKLIAEWRTEKVQILLGW